jgi:hypothetical protein
MDMGIGGVHKSVHTDSCHATEATKNHTTTGIYGDETQPQAWRGGEMQSQGYNRMVM